MDNKKRRLQIPLTIVTEFDEPTNPMEKAGMIRERSVAYVEAIFATIQTQARQADYLDAATDKPGIDFSEFRANVQALCEIGRAFVANLE